VEQQSTRTWAITSVVVDILEVAVDPAATPLKRARATTPKATQAALRCRMFRLEVDMVVYYLLARVARQENESPSGTRN